jgi:Ca2+-binding EF-hand superfamily protein
MRNLILNSVLLRLSAVLFFLTATQVCAAAQDGALAQMDTNGDGVISEQEWMDSAKARFDRLDSNHDGVLDPQELQQARDNVRQRFRSQWEQRRGAAGTAP